MKQVLREHLRVAELSLSRVKVSGKTKEKTSRWQKKAA